MNLPILRTWDGRPARDDERYMLRLDYSAKGLKIEIDAPFHDDPPPPLPPGRCDGLWNHEVVELFLVGASHYVELEFGPHGHFLGLEFSAVRQRSRDDLRIAFETERMVVGERPRWRGLATIEASELPHPVLAANGFAVHGAGAIEGSERRYLAAYPTGSVGDEAPDFHRPDRFPSVDSIASGR